MEIRKMGGRDVCMCMTDEVYEMDMWHGSDDDGGH